MAGYFYFNLGQYQGDQVRGTLAADLKIASVTELVNDARWKTNQSFGWVPLRAGMDMASGDSVFSGEASHVTLQFLNQNSLELHENTLVTLVEVKAASKGEPPGLDLQMTHGKINLKAKQKSVLTLHNLDESINLQLDQSSHTQVEAQPHRAIKVALQAGSAEVSYRGNSKKVNSNEAVEIVNEGVIRPLSSIVASSPTKIVEDEKNPKIIPSPKQDVVQGPIDQSLAAPEGQVPFHENTVYLYQGNPLNVHFVWSEAGTPAKSYQIQIADNDVFRSVSLSKTVEATTVDLVLPKTGKFYWRVRALYAKNTSPWSEVKIFSVEYSK